MKVKDWIMISISAVGIVLIASGVIGRQVAFYHIERLTEAQIVVEHCEFETIESGGSERPNTPSCNAVREVSGKDVSVMEDHLSGFYETHRSIYGGNR